MQATTMGGAKLEKRYSPSFRDDSHLAAATGGNVGSVGSNNNCNVLPPIGGAANNAATRKQSASKRKRDDTLRLVHITKPQNKQHYFDRYSICNQKKQENASAKVYAARHLCCWSRMLYKNIDINAKHNYTTATTQIQSCTKRPNSTKRHQQRWWTPPQIAMDHCEWLRCKKNKMTTMTKKTTVGITQLHAHLYYNTIPHIPCVQNMYVHFYKYMCIF